MWARAVGHHRGVHEPRGASIRTRGGRTAAILVVLAALGLGMSGTAPASAETGPTAADVAYDGSVDRVDGSVYRLYRAFFLREPDADGLVYWIVQARYARYPVGSIAEEFARSEEFRRRYGSLADGAFVDLVYRNVLGRTPDASGRAYWIDQLRRGMRRGHLMLYFSDSVEFARTVGAGPFGARDYRGPAQAAPTAPAGSYLFLDPVPGSAPVGWAKCRPVYVVANPAGIPPAEHDDFFAMLDHALDAVSDATGQDWVHVGRTAFRAADRNSSNYVPGLVSISFMTAPDPQEAALAWANNVPGQNPVTSTRTYLSGSVNLNARNLVTDFGGEVTPLVATTLMHELGHVAGLDHVEDASQLMAHVYQMSSEDPAFESYRNGDRAGLARVGSTTTTC